MYDIVMNKDMSGRLFFALKRGMEIYCSDRRIADTLGVSLKSYLERVSKLHEKAVIKENYAYFELSTSDNKEELIDKFKNEFIKELTTLKLCGDILCISKYK